MNIYYTLLFF